jgi:23S rRNA (cytosine1962-C5)-methyltransferase
LREIIVKAKKGARPLSVRKEIYEREILEGLKGCQPGEWVIVKEENTTDQVHHLGMANPMVARGAPVRILGLLKKGKSVSPEGFISEQCKKAFEKRRLFQSMDKGARLVYGEADSLPGLVVDEYVNAVIVQINTAGLDSYRDHLKNVLQELTKKDVYFLDNPEYREAESLPHRESLPLPDLEIEENGIEFQISKKVLQKIGYYYDHRVNRLKLKNWLEDFSGKCETGVDLFSYAGAWGLNALKGGCGHVTFVDQGDFSETLVKNLERNGFKERGTFVREDVFDWIKKGNKTYDVVISDPPAFSKTLKNKSKALGGYEKLHRGLSGLVHDGSLLVIASCTHGISHDELDTTVEKGFQDSPFQLTLLDLGIQGSDHSFGHFNERGFYIKFLLYLVKEN